jgi:uncharacterized membrane protein
MSDNILPVFENQSDLIFLILFVFLQTALWDWQSSRRSARRSMFFGARVGPDFIASACGDSILKRFRLRIWFLSLAVVLAYILFPWRSSSSPEYLDRLLLFPIFGSLIGNLIIFGLANRQTRREAVDLPGPSIRTAALFVEQDESSAWLTVLDWLGILLPIGIPLVAILVVILCWNQYPGNYSPLAELRRIVFMCVLGIFPAGTYFALRFRARSSDWAPDPRASRRYRTVLGLMQSSLFSFLIFNICWLSLVPLLNRETFGDLHTQFRVELLGLMCFIPIGLGLRTYLRRNLARESSDPMPDHCWKWGYFYYNPADPALIVPLRSGTAYSFNHARRSVWFVGTLLLSVALYMILSS